MKKSLALCLSFILIFALLAACGKQEPDRSYEKVAHHCPWWRISLTEDSDILYTFPPVTCYDDVVLYAKQYCYMTYGKMNNAPYTVMRVEDEGYWVYKSSVLDFVWTANNMGTKYMKPIDDECYEFAITDDGAVVYTRMYDIDVTEVEYSYNHYKPLEEKLSCEGIDFDLSNEFDFSYDDIKDFESLDMFIEKLEPVNSAEDVIERAKQLRYRTYKTDTLNPYSVCYDEKNDCWLYYEIEDIFEAKFMYFVIDSDGQLLMFTFYEPYLS